MRGVLSTTAIFVGKTGVTIYRKMSSVQYQLSDPKAGLSAKILNKSNVSRCTYYWFEPGVAASFKDYMPVQAVYGMTAGICHVRTMWQVKLCPLKYLSTLEELNLENVNVIKSATVIYSLLLGTCWTRFTNIQVDTVISSKYFHYDYIHSNIITSRAVNIYSTLCKNLLLGAYMHSLTVTMFSVLPMQWPKIFKVDHVLPCSALRHDWKAPLEALTHFHRGADGYTSKSFWHSTFWAVLKTGERMLMCIWELT